MLCTVITLFSIYPTVLYPSLSPDLVGVLGNKFTKLNNIRAKLNIICIDWIRFVHFIPSIIKIIQRQYIIFFV
jgi:hypothetical protein